MATSSSLGTRLEQEFQQLLGGKFTFESAGRALDFLSLDRAHGIELKGALQGTRDLHAALFQLAFALKDNAHLSRATLVARLPRMTARRVEREWLRVATTIDASISARMAIAAVTEDGDCAQPRDPQTLHILEQAKRLFALEAPREDREPGTGWDLKRFEVWKTLLDAWLLAEGPLAVQEIARRSGTSYPTVASTLERLRTREELRRTRSRSAELSGMPRRTLAEVLIVAPDLRRSRGFFDASGRGTDPHDLLRRLQRLSPPGVQLGGVPAARHHLPSFDLNGLPRVDVLVATDDRLDWVRDLDAALRPAHGEERSPLLVVHRTHRPHRPVTKKELPYASPAETLLDLFDLRLDGQANDFVQELRQKGTEHERKA